MNEKKERKISIDELRNVPSSDDQQIREVDLKSPQKETSAKQEGMNEIIEMVDIAVDRVKNESIEYRKKIAEEEEAAEEPEDNKSEDNNKSEEKVEEEFSFEDEEILDDKEDDDEEELRKPVSKTEKEEVIKVVPKDSDNHKESMEIKQEKNVSILNKDLPDQSEFSKISDDDFDDEEEDDERTEEEQEDMEIEEIQDAFREKVNSNIINLDLSSYKIRRDPVSVSNLLSELDDESVEDWILTASKTVVSMSKFYGQDIESLMNRNSNNQFAEQKRIFRTFYDHIKSAKPETFEKWIKTFLWYDVEDLYMAAYISAFKDANYIPYKCVNPKCNHLWISENTPIEKMIKYKDDKTKKEMIELLNSGKVTSNKIETSLQPLSEKIAIGIKAPTIFDATFQYAVLGDNFIRKYGNILTMTSFIEGFYMIDSKTKMLVPIEFNVYEDNLSKTIRSKIRKCSKILSKLSSDQYQTLIREINLIGKRYQLVEYQTPETVCPKCGAKIPSETVTADAMLFTRHQLIGPKVQ